MVGTYHIFSEWLSLIVKTRSSQAVKRLLDLQPDTARVVRGGREFEIDVGEVAEGDRVRIRPGERLPVDGEVVAGRSSVDQSLVTGIGVPVAATGLLYPVWAMVAMVVSVTAIFVNSLSSRPRLFLDAILSVGRPGLRQA